MFTQNFTNMTSNVCPPWISISYCSRTFLKIFSHSRIDIVLPNSRKDSIDLINSYSADTKAMSEVSIDLFILRAFDLRPWRLWHNKWYFKSMAVASVCVHSNVKFWKPCDTVSNFCAHVSSFTVMQFPRWNILLAIETQTSVKRYSGGPRYSFHISSIVITYILFNHRFIFGFWIF